MEGSWVILMVIVADNHLRVWWISGINQQQIQTPSVTVILCSNRDDVMILVSEVLYGTFYVITTDLAEFTRP